MEVNNPHNYAFEEFWKAHFLVSYRVDGGGGRPYPAWGGESLCYCACKRGVSVPYICACKRDKRATTRPWEGVYRTNKLLRDYIAWLAPYITLIYPLTVFSRSAGGRLHFGQNLTYNFHLRIENRNISKVSLTKPPTLTSWAQWSAVPCRSLRTGWKHQSKRNSLFRLFFSLYTSFFRSIGSPDPLFYTLKNFKNI